MASRRSNSACADILRKRAAASVRLLYPQAADLKGRRGKEIADFIQATLVLYPHISGARLRKRVCERFGPSGTPDWRDQRRQIAEWMERTRSELRSVWEAPAGVPEAKSS